MSGWQRLGLAPLLWWMVVAPALAGAEHRVQRDTPREVVADFSFSGVQLRPAWSAAGAHTEVSIPGLRSLPADGEPVLPVYNALIAVPLGTRPRLTLLGHAPLPVSSPLPPAVAGRDADGRFEARPLSTTDGPVAMPPWAVVEPIGVVRHLNLARITVRPVRYGSVEGWSALRDLKIRIDFDRLPTQPGALGALDDPLDISLASRVINPAAVGESLQADGGAAASTTAAIPTPRPSTMTPAKVLVREAGMVEVTRTDLTNAGVDPTGIDPDTFVLTNRDVEIALEVSGAGDGSFDPGDVIRFYGEPVGGSETQDNVYRLTGGSETGLRFGSRDATPGAETVPTEFTNTHYEEVNFLYWGSLPDSVPDPWHWTRLNGATPSVDYTFDLANISTAPGTAHLEVRMQSRREQSGPSPNHQIRIYLNPATNPTPVDDQSWTGLQTVTLEGDVAQSVLIEGTNTVRVEWVDLGLSVQEDWTDWFKLTYIDTFVAEADYLEFGADTAGPWRFEVTALTGSDAAIYDVSDPTAPVALTGVDVQPDGGGWKASFTDALASPPGRFVALRPGSAMPPFGVVADTVSGLRDAATTGADMLVVVHEDFWSSIQPLVSHRQAEGLRVVAGRVTDVLDEFNGGIAEAQGIKNFVDWAFDNYAPPAPTYLLLVGDATFDPADYKGEGDNYVSSSFFRAPNFGDAPTETWFGAVSGTDLVPDLAVGRVGARSVTDVDRYVDNVLDYETTPAQSALNSSLLYVADDDDASFENVLEDLIAGFHPPAMDVDRVYLDEFSTTGSARNAIRGHIDDGALLSSYVGHGGRTVWADESLWRLADVGNLAPSDHLTFVLALNCVNGWFVNIDSEPVSLSEQWLIEPDRGAIGNWAPSATGTLFNYDVLSDLFFDQVFVQRQTRTGLAAWQALIDAHLLFNVNITYVQQMLFFGDPAAVLPLDSDRDGRLDLDELGAGGDPDDADSDEDGLTDGLEPSWDDDSDGDGATNVADPDSDDDGLPDGLESGVDLADPSTDVGAGWFTADSDPLTTTDPLVADSDGGGAPDGAEDRDADGFVDAGETDPNVAGDDPTCPATAPAEISGVLLDKDGADVVLTWDDQQGADPCVLYRVYVAEDPGTPDDFSKFRYLATTTQPTFRHARASSDGRDYYYLVSAISPVGGEGAIGHYGQ